MTSVRAIVQARMSSARFPGKVLAPVAGVPLIERVLSALSALVGMENVSLATSRDRSDDPLAGFAALFGVHVYRGELENVLARTQGCMGERPCDQFFRVCADSPFLNLPLMRDMLSHRTGRDAAITTNVLPRTFPKGHSVELVSARSLLALDPETLERDDREHVTRAFYRQPASHLIVTYRNDDKAYQATDLTIDTVDDLKRLEGLYLAGAIPEGRVGTRSEEAPCLTAG